MSYMTVKTASRITVIEAKDKDGSMIKIRRNTAGWMCIDLINEGGDTVQFRMNAPDSRELLAHIGRLMVDN